MSYLQLNNLAFQGFLYLFCNDKLVLELVAILHHLIIHRARHSGSRIYVIRERINSLSYSLSRLTVSLGVLAHYTL